MLWLKGVKIKDLGYYLCVCILGEWEFSDVFKFCVCVNFLASRASLCLRDFCINLRPRNLEHHFNLDKLVIYYFIFKNFVYKVWCGDC